MDTNPGCQGLDHLPATFADMQHPGGWGLGPDGSSQDHLQPQNTTLVPQLRAAATELQKFASISRPATQPASPEHPSATACTTELLSPLAAWGILSPHHHTASSALRDPSSLSALPASSEHQKNSLDARSLHVTTKQTGRNRLFTRQSSPAQTEGAAADQRQVGGPQVYIFVDPTPSLRSELGWEMFGDRRPPKESQHAAGQYQAGPLQIRSRNNP